MKQTVLLLAMLACNQYSVVYTDLPYHHHNSENDLIIRYCTCNAIYTIRVSGELPDCFDCSHLLIDYIHVVASISISCLL